jgi:DNA-directed RNA polymerase specialized sigma24 family protein
MTTQAHAALRRYVAQPTTRTSLRAYVRRRGFFDDADDLVQTVLCDALAVQAVPAEPEDLPRWITGIARRKVADERRRRARWKHEELPDFGASTHPEHADLLKRIDADLADPEQRRALSYLLREHAGNSLLEIAREQALRPETLRQRICRLRRHLRAVHFLPLLLVLGLGVATLPHYRPPAVRPSVETVTELAGYQGRWHVLAAAPNAYLAESLQILVGVGNARVINATGLVERDLQIEALDQNRLRLRAGNSVWDVTLNVADPNHIKLSGPRGFVELERATGAK